jgi:hypothetical protein
MAAEKFGASEHFACKVIGQNRSAFRKKQPEMGFEEARLRAALRDVAGKHPAWVAEDPLASAGPDGVGWCGTEQEAGAPALAKKD